MVFNNLLYCSLLITQPIIVSPFLVASATHVFFNQRGVSLSVLAASSTQITMPSDTDEPKAKKSKKSDEGAAEVKRNDEGKYIVVA